MARVCVIGAGIMGLAAGYQALLDGHEVTIFEASAEAGGMAAHFDLGDISIERFYHSVCKTDFPTFELLAELGIADRMRWVRTSMGYFIGGRLHRWGDPLALLRFPHLNLVQKLRYAWLAFVSTRGDNWPSLEHRDAREWITSWCGAVVYDRMWRRLFEQKFFDQADRISAAWIWTRIRRVGRSRRNLMQEELGYIEGGSQTLVAALCEAITARGGKLQLGALVRRVLTDAGRVTGVAVGERIVPADFVICTVPTPLVPQLVPDLPAAALDAYRAIVNIGVVCVVLRLKRRVTPHFWVNINEPDIDVPGMIEFSNLRAVKDTIVYVPHYMPVTNPKWTWTEAEFVADAMACLWRINPELEPGDLVNSHVGRLRHAQPICGPEFTASLPPV